MDRIKARIALLLAAMAVSSIFVAAPAARAADSCHPYPEQYCNTMNWYYRCVVGPIIYQSPDPWCAS